MLGEDDSLSADENFSASSAKAATSETKSENFVVSSPSDKRLKVLKELNADGNQSMVCVCVCVCVCKCVCKCVCYCVFGRTNLCMYMCMHVVR